MRSVYVKAEPQASQVSGEIMGVEEAKRERVDPLDNGNIFFLVNRGGSRPDGPSERNPVFLVPKLEHHETSLVGGRTENKTKLKLLPQGPLQFSVGTAFPRSWYLKEDILHSSGKMAAGSRSFLSLKVSALTQTVSHTGKSKNCGRLTLRLTLMSLSLDHYPLLGWCALSIHPSLPVWLK